jgi:hypothetical protein
MLNVVEKMDKALVLADVSRSNTLMYLNSHNFNSLIGSDILD